MNRARAAALLLLIGTAPLAAQAKSGVFLGRVTDSLGTPVPNAAIALLGNPWTGRGMDMGGMHATFLAESIDGCLKGTTPEVESMAAYHRRRNDHAIEPFRQTVTFGRDIRAMLAS